MRLHNGHNVSVVSWPHRRRMSGVGRVLVVTRSEKLERAGERERERERERKDGHGVGKRWTGTARINRERKRERKGESGRKNEPQTEEWRKREDKERGSHGM